MGAKLGGGGRGRRGRSVMAEINVTPMVDVMLVLLVIFMVAAPLLSAGVAVDLPKAQARPISQKDNKPLEISLDARGEIYLGETALRLETLLPKLEAIAAETPDLRVYIKADQRLDYGRVMDIMAAVNRSGFTRIALVTDPSSAKK